MSTYMSVCNAPSKSGPPSIQDAPPNDPTTSLRSDAIPALRAEGGGGMMKGISLNLSKRFLLLFGGLVLLTAFSARLFYTRQETADLEIRLNEKAVFINGYYATRIAESLVRKDD